MATKKPARKKTTKVPEYFVHISSELAQQLELSSGEFIFKSLADAQKDAEHLFDVRHYDYTSDVGALTIYKLVPVRRLSKPKEVVVEDL